MFRRIAAMLTMVVIGLLAVPALASAGTVPPYAAPPVDPAAAQYVSTADSTVTTASLASTGAGFSVGYRCGHRPRRGPGGPGPGVCRQPGSEVDHLIRLIYGETALPIRGAVSPFMLPLPLPFRCHSRAFDDPIIAASLSA